MAGMNSIDEIDCASFFDHFDDLIEFPPVNDTGLNSVDCDEFSNLWANNSGDLQVVDSIFGGGNSDGGSTNLSAEIAVPYEDPVQLKWLSNLADNSFSGGEMSRVIVKKEYIADHNDTVVGHNVFQTASPVSVLESSSSSSSSASYPGSGSNGGPMIPLGPIQRGLQRARTKRPRPATFNPRAMADLLSPMVLVPVSACSAGQKDFTTHGPREPDEKKTKKIKKPKIHEENENQIQNRNRNQDQSGQGVRKCLHCEITKTPQWRAGPMGPKTLCNACGVRYKSGRLFPEYRPAASPTFIPTLHSNSHKKVVEMRTKFGPNDKMVIMRSEPEPELIPNINPNADYV